MFYLKGIPICIRQLEETDVKYSFYNLMTLLSKENIQLINTSTIDELRDKLNYNHKIFVIINVNTSCVIGTGTVKIMNKNSLYSVCIISDINIYKDYNNNNNNGNNSGNSTNESVNDLHEIFLKYLIDYCRYQEKCVKYILKIYDDKEKENIL